MAFRRLIQERRRRRMQPCSTTTNISNRKQILSLQAIQSHRPLARLLVLAKRAKIQHEYQQAWKRLEQDIPKELPATVTALGRRFANLSLSCWPSSPQDVEVFLQHQVQDGVYEVVRGVSKECVGAPQGILAPHLVLGLVPRDRSSPEPPPVLLTEPRKKKGGTESRPY